MALRNPEGSGGTWWPKLGPDTWRGLQKGQPIAPQCPHELGGARAPPHPTSFPPFRARRTGPSPGSLAGLSPPRLWLAGPTKLGCGWSSARDSARGKLEKQTSPDRPVRKAEAGKEREACLIKEFLQLSGPPVRLAGLEKPILKPEPAAQPFLPSHTSRSVGFPLPPRRAGPRGACWESQYR